MEKLNKETKEKDNKKAKATMMFSLGEKRIEKFRSKADELELNYSSIVQQLIDEWLKSKR